MGKEQKTPKENEEEKVLTVKIKNEVFTRGALVSKYGKDKLRILDIPKDDSATEFLKDVVVVIPNRNVMGQFQKWQDMNPKKASEILVKGCVLDDNQRKEILDESDDYLFNTTVSALSELIPIGNANIKAF